MKKLIPLVLGLTLLSQNCSKQINLPIKNFDYSCAGGTGPVVGHKSSSLFGASILQTLEDNNDDGKPDAQVTYIFDEGCLRKIRVLKPYTKETEKESTSNNLDSLSKYLDYKSESAN